MSLNPVAPGAGARDLRRGITTANPQALANPVFNDASYARGSLPFFLLRISISALLPFIIALGAMFQVQMLLLHGHIVANSVDLKLLFMFPFLLGMFLRARFSHRRVVAVTLVFVSFLILDGIRFYFSLNIAGVDVVQGANSYYSYVFLAVLALMVPFRLPERRVIQIFVWTFIACAVVGLAQFIANKPLIPDHSSDGSFEVNGTQAVNFRPFSLFTDVHHYGMIGVVAASLGFAYWRRRRRVVGLPLLLSGILVTVTAGSREVMPSLVAALGTVALLTHGASRRWHRLLPLLWLGLGVSVVGIGYVLASGGGVTHTLSDTSTLIIRLQNWQTYAAMFGLNDPWGILFGFGLVENHNAATSAVLVPIDNLFLCTTLHIGLVGLALCIALLWTLWREALSAAQETDSALAIAVAAAFSTFLCLGMFQPTAAPACTYFILYAVSQTAMFRRVRDQR